MPATRISRATRLRFARPPVSWAVSLSSAIGPGRAHVRIGPVQQVYPLCQGRVSGRSPPTGRLAGSPDVIRRACHLYQPAAV